MVQASHSTAIRAGSIATSEPSERPFSARWPHCVAMSQARQLPGFTRNSGSGSHCVSVIPVRRYSVLPAGAPSHYCIVPPPSLLSSRTGAAVMPGRSASIQRCFHALITTSLRVSAQPGRHWRCLSVLKASRSRCRLLHQPTAVIQRKATRLANSCRRSMLIYSGMFQQVART